MRKIALSIIAVLLLSLTNSNLSAQQRTKAKSLSIAKEKLLTSKAVLALEDEALRVYNNADQEGFVIVSADEQLPEVLGFSDKGTFDPTNIPSNMQFWMDMMKETCDAVVAGTVSVEEAFAASASNKEIAPLLGDIEWSQEEPYNLKCPKVGGKNTVTGCGATAMAMLMKYYNYPEVGTGTISYTTATQKIKVNYDFSETVFDWDNMLPGYSIPNSFKLVERVSEDFGQTIVYASLVPYASHGGIYVLADSLWNASGKDFEGQISFLLYDTEDNFLESVGEVMECDPFPKNTWYPNPGAKFVVSMPASYPDGDYLLYLAYKAKGTKEWVRSIEFETIDNSAQPHYPRPLTITKKDRKVFVGEFEGYCSYDKTESDAVANLMFACGAALQMDYGVEESSSSITAPFTSAYKNFGYDRDAYIAYSPTIDTNIENQLIVEQLEKNQPVYIGGITKNNAGHAFIADGVRYSTMGNPMFHINWGWSGMSNGYFLISNLNPDATGTGASDGDNFSHKLYLVCGMKPKDDVSEGPVVTYKQITCNQERAEVGERISISVSELMNISPYPISGLASAFLVSDKGVATKIGDIMTNMSNLETLSYYSSALKLNATVPSSLGSGDYTIEVRAALSTDKTNYGRSVAIPTKIYIYNPTGIIDVINDETDAPVVDLLGRSVQNMNDGNFYIKGNKVIRK